MEATLSAEKADRLRNEEMIVSVRLFRCSEGRSLPSASRLPSQSHLPWEVWTGLSLISQEQIQRVSLSLRSGTRVWLTNFFPEVSDWASEGTQDALLSWIPVSRESVNESFILFTTFKLKD